MWSSATAAVMCGRRRCSPRLCPPPPRPFHCPPVRARSKAGGPARRRNGDTLQPRRFAEFGLGYNLAMRFEGLEHHQRTSHGRVRGSLLSMCQNHELVARSYGFHL